MVLSKIDSSVSYPELKRANPEDADMEADIYALPIKNVEVVIALGNSRDDFRKNNIIYFPIYLVKSNKKVVQIGIFEVEKNLLLHGYLHAFTSNILSAALRIMPIGQTEIQKIIFQMKGNVEEMTNKSLGLSLSDLGSSVFISDWASSKHQNQYTRLFRS